MRDDIRKLLSAAGPAAILLNLGGLMVGFGIATAVGLPLADRLTTAVELGIKNSTLGILIAVTVIGSEWMAVPPAVYGVLMYVSAAAVVAFGRRRLDPIAARRDRTLEGAGTD